eukprot:1986159-Pyramimonas_sp.AAC.1
MWLWLATPAHFSNRCSGLCNAYTGWRADHVRAEAIAGQPLLSHRAPLRLFWIGGGATTAPPARGRSSSEWS